jgi:CRP/FNR family transcriptional regulator
MTNWLPRAHLPDLPTSARAALSALRPVTLPRGHVIFRPGDPAQGFALILSGRVDVFLTGPTGRDILLYAVEPGQSCIQTTLGLLGDEDYTGEAIAATEVDAVLVPRTLFLTLMDTAPPFRAFVFRAFATRMQSMMHVLEKVAFQKVESRLAQTLLDLATDNIVTATHADLATRIGSAREVVSRRLDSFARRGWVETDRGTVRLTVPAALARLAATDGAA